MRQIIDEVKNNMSKDNKVSVLNRVQSFVHKCSEQIIRFTTTTADFIAPLFYKGISFVTKVHDKIADFVISAKYESKSFVYNQYDKVRTHISLNKTKETTDSVEYKGEPTPTFSKRVSSFMASKVDGIKSKMPRSGAEFKESFVRNHKNSKRSIRRGFLNAKEEMAVFLTTSKEYIQGLRKTTIAGMGAVVVGGFMLTLMLSTIVNSYAMGVTINGEKVGFVENKEEFSTLVEEVKQELSKENHNANIEIDEEAIKLDSMAKSKDEVNMLDEDKLKEKLIDKDAIVASAAAITVDGKELVNVASKDDAYGVLMSIRAKYDVSGQDVFAGFTEDVSVKSIAVDVNEITPTDTAITYLLTGNEKIEKYKCKKDDTFWDIAVDHGLSEKELKAANPGINATKIKDGDVINISKTVPFVHLEVTATVNVTEKTNYTTKKIKTNDLYVGETKVKEEGERGETSVTKRAIYINGKEKTADVLSEKVIKKSKERVVLVGTKEKPASSSGGYSSGGSSYSSGGGSYNSSNGGTLSNPLRSMTFSSGFGYRGGSFHAGIDYRNPAGSPIYAAAAGKVTFAGWDGGYGNTVRISHGNGMVTVYAHCSSLTVRSGASVARGQQIAKVGSTGWSTGNHLHFEVRINGKAVNPAGYL